MPQHLLREEKNHSTVWKAEGLWDNQYKALNAYQQECVDRLGLQVHLDNASYIMRHPEIKAMMKTCLGRGLKSKWCTQVKDMALYFTQPIEKLDNDIRQELKLRPGEPYHNAVTSPITLQDQCLEEDIDKITKKFYPDAPLKLPTTEISLSPTISSSFLSILTSEMTVPTPEPTPIPEPTTSEIFYNMISNTVDKATLTGITDDDILYDTAYVELMKIVEVAMEIPVKEIREDIATLIDLAYRIFECYEEDQEKRQAEIAWEKRMRKKLKRTLRRQMNFKGYETPPTPKSKISSHPSYKEAPPRPCVCQPQWKYNRYPKDRFGIYLPRDIEFCDGNLTVTPVISVENLTQDADNTEKETS